jgi:hypothetical protein
VSRKATNAARALAALGLPELPKAGRQHLPPSKLAPEVQVQLKGATIDAARSKRERKALKRLVQAENQRQAAARSKEARAKAQRHRQIREGGALALGEAIHRELEEELDP